MEVLSLQVFVSLVLVFGSIVLFAHAWRQRDFDHADRLALLPMADDTSARNEPIK
jgi:hypothetical protein